MTLTKFILADRGLTDEQEHEINKVINKIDVMLLEQVPAFRPESGDD